MIVTCPSCATRYLVDPVALGETGRMVRCARCTHAWTQAPPEDMPKRVDVIRPPDEATLIPPGSNLPAIPERGASASPAGWIALVLALVVVIGGVLAGRNQIVAAWPQAAQLYGLVGLPQETPAQGLELRNVQQSTFVENEQTIVVVSGEIANLSSQTVRLPNIVAQVMDKDERILESWVLTLASTQLGPGETIEFSDRFADPPKDAVRLLVVLESKG